ncbi:Abi-alpha family protein [Pararhizobium sp.]|uniref:Abi-alpha family protein n=1 Tax=Pararhizobium sp. TaxID=1977563 RepID=UPI003D0AB36F
MAEAPDMAVVIATEIAKQLPVKAVYDDGIARPLRVAGDVMTDILKTLHLALAPLQVAAALQDRFVDFLNTSIRRVREQDRIAPPPQILGPIIEAIRYEPDGTPINEMFSQLLTRAFDKDRVNEAHPSFPLLIKQLSSDEASLLFSVWRRQQEGGYFRQQIHQNYDATMNHFYGVTYEIDEVPTSRLAFPKNVTFYGHHLHSLGLTAFYDWKMSSALWSPADESGRLVQIGLRTFKELRLTDFGWAFMKAVDGLNAS